MFHYKKDTMKCPQYETARAKKMEKCSAADTVESKAFHLKTSPVKEPLPINPHYSPVKVNRALFTLNTSAVHDKENSNSKEHDRTVDGGLEDSGYASLHNSQIEDHHVDEEDHIQGRPTAILLPTAAFTHQEKTISPKQSPICQVGTRPSHQMSLESASTPVNCCRRRKTTYSLSSTPNQHHDDTNLPILKFQRAACEELAKSYQKNKRYDWSVVTKVAEGHLLDRVIGSKMGREYVDMFSSLLSRNMRSILTNILALLGDMDLISCKKVSRTWKRIISNDTTALKRCRLAEQSLQESRSSLTQKGSGLTRDVGVSRMVLSCIQTLASTSTPSSSSSSSSSTPTSGVNRRIALSQKGNKPNSQSTRFTEYVLAAGSLKQHESLRSCKRCGSPATHSAEVQRATCTRQNCLFDFCSRCQESFHGSTPCRVIQTRSHFPSSKTTPIVQGGARSKRNIRRL